MKQFFNVRTVRFFLLCFICLFLISGSLATGPYLDETAKEKKNYQIALTEETQKISKYFTSSFSGVVTACNAIFLSRWYTHFRNSADIYRDEFDPLRRSEIQQELVSKMVTMEFVSDILIVTPHQNSVIGKNG